jgi:hypothetical protein
LSTEIGGLVNSSQEGVRIVERAVSDDPLVKPLVQLRQPSGDGHRDEELEELKCEKSFGPSHVEDGDGEARQLIEEILYQENPYWELKGLMCQRSSGPSQGEDGGGDALQPRGVGQWLIRGQLEVPERESQFEITRKQKERLRDLKHYLRQE